MDFSQLIDRWRRDIQVLRKRGASAQAEVMQSCINDLERYAVAYDREELTLQAASREGGYSVSQLSRHLKDGVIPNCGREEAPRIRRAHVPVKPGYKVGQPEPTTSVSAEHVSGDDPAAHVLRAKGLETDY